MHVTHSLSLALAAPEEEDTCMSHTLSLLLLQPQCLACKGAAAACDSAIPLVGPLTRERVCVTCMYPPPLVGALTPFSQPLHILLCSCVDAVFTYY
jgi:hypothetical protein